MSNLVEELINEGLVCESGHGQSTGAGGKRPILLELNTNAGFILAVYFNERWYEIALTNLAAETVTSIKKPTVIDQDYRKTLDLLIQDIRELMRAAQTLTVSRPVLACGVAVKGLVNTHLGTLQYSAAIPEWTDVSVGEHISNQLKLPVYLENDARAITYAEMLFGNGVKNHVFICVSMGHGIGTGVAIQNEIFRGAYDGAVTFAHTTVMENGPLCRCGNRGCWETVASVSAFLNELERRDYSYHGMELQEVLKKYHEGDPVISDVLLNYSGYWIGVGIANMLNVFNPEQVIIQGEITAAGEEFREKIASVVMKRALPVSRKAEISFSRLSDSIYIKGAAAVVIQRFYAKEHHQEIWPKPSLPVKEGGQ